MPNFVNNTITIQGEGQIAAALAGTQLVITRVQVGSGVATGSLPPLTALIAPVMNLTPVPPQVSANNLQTGEVVVMTTLDSANVTATFSLAELGVYARSGGGPEQLIVYCQCSAPYDSIAPGTGQNRLQLNLQVPLVVGPGASVSITVQAGNPVYIPPVVAGPGIIVDAPTNANGQVIEWIVSTPRIVNSTNLWVANEYTQNIAPYFSSIQNAMNYLGTFAIASGVYVWINVAPEIFNLTSTTYVGHNNGQQIVIQGAQYADVSFNGIGSITGSAGNWQVQLLNVSDTTNIKVGTWLNIYYVGWNWMSPLVGGTFYVTAIAGSTVTILNYYYASSWPNMAGTSGWMTPLNTILNVTDNKSTYGLFIYETGLYALRNIAVINWPGQATNYLAAGIALGSGNMLCQSVGVWGFRGNTGMSGGLTVGGACVLTCENCSASLNDNGFSAAGGGANLNYYGCISSHNLQRGIWLEGGGTLACYAGIYNTPNFVAGNRERGILVSDNSYACVIGSYANGQPVNQPLMVSYNNSYGIHLWNQSRAAFSNSSTVFWCAYNGTYDVALNQMSSVTTSSYIQGTRKFNCTPNILTADGCLLSG
jgi:hypothetical protein